MASRHVAAAASGAAALRELGDCYASLAPGQGCPIWQLRRVRGGAGWRAFAKVGAKGRAGCSGRVERGATRAGRLPGSNKSQGDTPEQQIMTPKLCCRRGGGCVACIAVGAVNHPNPRSRCRHPTVERWSGLGWPTAVPCPALPRPDGRPMAHPLGSPTPLRPALQDSLLASTLAPEDAPLPFTPARQHLSTSVASNWTAILMRWKSVFQGTRPDASILCFQNCNNGFSVFPKLRNNVSFYFRRCVSWLGAECRAV